MHASAAEQEWFLEAAGASVRDFFAAIGVQLPDRGEGQAQVRCFANPGSHQRDDRTASCSINTATGLWKCHACGEAGNAYQAALAVGMREREASELAKRHGLFIQREKARMPWERELRAWRQALREHPQLLARVREVKGWTLAGLVRCSVGWDGERFTFVSRNRRLKIVGLVRYLPAGKPKTLTLPGSKRELFPMPETCSRTRPLFVVEGEPDAVAVWSCGHQAVAVPGAASWRYEWFERLAKHRVIVLGDCDQPGRKLAAEVARMLPNAKHVELDASRSDGYDIGDVVAEASREGGLGQVRRMLDDFGN